MRTATIVFLVALPLQAQQWSASVATGPFVFGHFAEHTSAIANENGSSITHSRLSAATRAGAAGDLERDFGRWLGVRLQASWTEAPLSVKSSGSGIAFDAGRLNATTLTLPVIARLNRGAFQFHLMGGPAYGLYNVHRRVGSGATVPLFEGTRGRFGGVGGVGVAWWWRPRFGVEWQAVDIVTGSPFHVIDISATSKGVHIRKPQNGHTTIGIRYRF